MTDETENEKLQGDRNGIVEVSRWKYGHICQPFSNPFSPWPQQICLPAVTFALKSIRNTSSSTESWQLLKSWHIAYYWFDQFFSWLWGGLQVCKHIMCLLQLYQARCWKSFLEWSCSFSKNCEASFLSSLLALIISGRMDKKISKGISYLGHNRSLGGSCSWPPCLLWSSARIEKGDFWRYEKGDGSCHLRKEWVLLIFLLLCQSQVKGKDGERGLTSWEYERVGG